MGILPWPFPARLGGFEQFVLLCIAVEASYVSFLLNLAGNEEASVTFGMTSVRSGMISVRFGMISVRSELTSVRFEMTSVRFGETFVRSGMTSVGN
jgi:hypothetical protein